MSAKFKIKVHAIGVIDSAAVPVAVIVADLRRGKEFGTEHARGDVAPRTERYVLLDYDRRAAISRMLHDLKRTDALAPWAPSFSLPLLVRTHHWDAAGRVVDLDAVISNGIWMNAEPLWVSTNLAVRILDDFNAWRDRFPCSDRGWFPNWNTLVGVQALVLAAGGLRVPSADDVDERRRAYEVGFVNCTSGEG